MRTILVLALTTNLLFSAGANYVQGAIAGQSISGLGQMKSAGP
jgi:hypothetical protein